MIHNRKMQDFNLVEPPHCIDGFVESRGFPDIQTSIQVPDHVLQ